MVVELTLKRNRVGNSFVRTVCLVTLAVFLYIQKQNGKIVCHTSTAYGGNQTFF